MRYQKMKEMEYQKTKAWLLMAGAVWIVALFCVALYATMFAGRDSTWPVTLVAIVSFLPLLVGACWVFIRQVCNLIRSK